MGEFGKSVVILMLGLWTVECRLSSAVRPVSYKLSLDLSSGLDNPAGTYRGSVGILLNVATSLRSNNFSLHASGLAVRSSSVSYHNSFGDLPVNHSILLNKTADILTVISDKELPSGDYILTIDFEGNFRPDLSGFYRSSYQENGLTKWVASTQFETSSARKAFPCFDDPRMRAVLTLDITVPKTLHAVANVPVLITFEQTNGTKKIQFGESPAMPTYLFAWYVADESFGELAATIVNGISYGVHGQTSLRTEALYALEVAPKVIQQLETFTGVPYGNAGLTKMDQVAVPDFNAGAMENWALVTYRESHLLYNNVSSTVRDKQLTMLVIAHEFAHQWFGDSVTLDWWSYTWLNEAFARYFQYIVPMKLEPDWMLENQFLTDVVQLSMASDFDSHPLTNPNVTTVAEMEGMFDVITYSKGASILRMFSTILGEEHFKGWLKTYLTNVISSGRVATPNDLWAALPNPNLTTQFQSWTNVGNHPVVKASKVVTANSTYLVISQAIEATNGSLLATQLKVPIRVSSKIVTPLNFKLLSGNESSSEPTYSIHPLNTSSAAADYFWLESNQTARMVPSSSWPDWYLINENTTGYYRVLYDDANWRALRIAISRSEIPPMIRAQLVSDAINLMTSGYLNPGTAFEFINFLANETDLLVWKSALTAFGRLRGLLMGWNNATLHIEKRVGTLMNQAFVMQFMDPPNNYTHYETMLRSYVAYHICVYNTTSCAALNGLPISHWPFVESHDRELSGAFLCETVKSDPWMWSKLLSMYHNATSPALKRRYLMSLTCTTNATSQLELLNYVLDPSVIKRQDYQVISSICDAQNGPQSVMTFVKTNGTKLAKYLSNKEHVKNLLSSIAQKLYTPKMLQDLDGIIQNTELGLTKEEKNSVILKAQKMNRMRSTVATRICQGLNIICSPPDDSEPNKATALIMSPVMLISVLTVAYQILWQ